MSQRRQLFAPELIHIILGEIGHNGRQETDEATNRLVERSRCDQSLVRCAVSDVHDAVHVAHDAEGRVCDDEEFEDLLRRDAPKRGVVDGAVTYFIGGSPMFVIESQYNGGGGLEPTAAELQGLSEAWANLIAGLASSGASAAPTP